MPTGPLEERSDHVRVRKRLVTDVASHPVVELSVTSFHTGEASVRLVEPLPAGFDAGDVAFRPGDEDHWTVDDGRLTYANDIEWGGDVETGYAVDVETPEEATPFMAELRLEFFDEEGDRIDEIRTATDTTEGPTESDTGAGESGADSPDEVSEEPADVDPDRGTRAQGTAASPGSEDETGDGRGTARRGGVTDDETATTRGSVEDAAGGGDPVDSGDRFDGVYRASGSDPTDLAGRFDRSHALAAEDDAVNLLGDSRDDGSTKTREERSERPPSDGSGEPEAALRSEDGGG